MVEIKGGFQGDLNTDIVKNHEQVALEAQARADEDARIREETSLFDLTTESEWLHKAGNRLIEREARVASVDSSFTVRTGELDELRQTENLSSQDESYLREAVSQLDFDRKLGHIKEDKERKRKLEAYGWQGVAGQVAAGVLDPAGWLLAATSGGSGGVAKFGMLGNAIKGGLLMGTQAALEESLLIQSDTQRDMDQLIYSVAAGATLGAGFGAAFGKTTVGNAADDVTDAMRKDVDLITNKSIDEAVDSVEGLSRKGDALVEDAPITFKVSYGSQVESKLDTDSVSLSIKTHRKSLSDKVLTVPPKGRKTAPVKQKVKRLEADILKLEIEWKKAHAKEAAILGAATSKVMADVRMYKLDKVAEQFAPRLEKLDKQLAEAKDYMDKALNHKQYRKALDDFDAKGRSGQEAELFPKGLPQVTKEVQAARKASLEIKAVKVPHTELTKQMETDGDLPILKTGDDAGAARVKGAIIEREIFKENEAEGIRNIMQDLADLADELPVERATLVGKQSRFTDSFQSLATTFDRSADPILRALGAKFFEQTQGVKVARSTVGADLYIDFNRIRGAVKNRYNEGFEEWMEEQGANVGEKLIDYGNKRAIFDDAVYLSMTTGSKGSPAVLKAADGLADGYKLALELRRESGEHGFKNVTSDTRYVPRIMEPTKLLKMTETHTRADLITALSKGYMTGGIKLKQKTADWLAEIQYERTLNKNLSGDVAFKNVVKLSDRAAFKDDLIKAGMDETAINDMLRKSEIKDLDENVSSRAKVGFFINPAAEHNGIKVIDMLNTDLPQISESYFREAAGGSAMAKAGFSSQHQIEEVLVETHKGAIERGMSKGRADIEVGLLRDAVKMTYGKSLDKDPSGFTTVAFRRIREYTGMIRLQQNGFAQFPELGRALSQFGVRAVLKEIPATGFFMRRNKRVGGKSSGELNEPVLREQERALGYVGEDSWFSTSHVTREDDWGEETKKGLSRVLDNAMATGNRATRILSGFQAVQGGLEKVVMRAASKRLVDQLSGDFSGKGSKKVNGIKGFDHEAMNRIGWDEDFLGKLQDFFDKNPLSEDFNGKSIRLLNLEAMPTDLRNNVLRGLNRIKGQTIQRNFLGNESAWMNTAIGKTLSQFRTFSIVSMEKQLMHDIKHDRINGAQTLMWTSALGLMAYSVQANLNALGKEDPDEFLDKAMSTKALMFGIFNKLPQTASLSLGGDFLATLGLLPDDMMASAESGGFRAMGAGSVPAFDTIGSVFGLGVQAVNVLTDDDTDLEGADVAQSARKLVPLLNGFAIGQAVSAAINSTR